MTYHQDRMEKLKMDKLWAELQEKWAAKSKKAEEARTLLVEEKNSTPPDVEAPPPDYQKPCEGSEVVENEKLCYNTPNYLGDGEMFDRNIKLVPIAERLERLDALSGEGLTKFCKKLADWCRKNDINPGQLGMPVIQNHSKDSTKKRPAKQILNRILYEGPYICPLDTKDDIQSKMADIIRDIKAGTFPVSRYADLIHLNNIEPTYDIYRKKGTEEQLEIYDGKFYDRNSLEIQPENVDTKAIHAQFQTFLVYAVKHLDDKELVDIVDKLLAQLEPNKFFEYLALDNVTAASSQPMDIFQLYLDNKGRMNEHERNSLEDKSRTKLENMRGHYYRRFPNKRPAAANQRTAGSHTNSIDISHAESYITAMQRFAQQSPDLGITVQKTAKNGYYKARHEVAITSGKATFCVYVATTLADLKTKIEAIDSLETAYEVYKWNLSIPAACLDSNYASLSDDIKAQIDKELRFFLFNAKVAQRYMVAVVDHHNMRSRTINGHQVVTGYEYNTASVVHSPVFGLSVEQQLAITCFAANDEEKFGTLVDDGLDDAGHEKPARFIPTTENKDNVKKRNFVGIVKGLYEAQRGGNIDLGSDDKYAFTFAAEQVDKANCDDRAVKSMMDAVLGRVAYFERVVVTNEIFAAKIKATVQNCVIACEDKIIHEYPHLLTEWHFGNGIHPRVLASITAKFNEKPALNKRSPKEELVKEFGQYAINLDGNFEAVLKESEMTETIEHCAIAQLDAGRLAAMILDGQLPLMKSSKAGPISTMELVSKDRPTFIGDLIAVGTSEIIAFVAKSLPIGNPALATEVTVGKDGYQLKDLKPLTVKQLDLLANHESITNDELLQENNATLLSLLFKKRCFNEENLQFLFPLLLRAKAGPNTVQIFLENGFDIYLISLDEKHSGSGVTEFFESYKENPTAAEITKLVIKHFNRSGYKDYVVNKFANGIELTIADLARCTDGEVAHVLSTIDNLDSLDYIWHEKIIEIVQFLHKVGKLSDKEYKSTEILHMAASIGLLDVIKTAKEKGAEFGCRFSVSDAPAKKSLLALAIENSQVDVIRYLVKEGIYKITDSCHKTRNLPALQIACEKKADFETFKTLIELGADVNILLPSGTTLLSWAIAGEGDEQQKQFCNNLLDLLFARADLKFTHGEFAYAVTAGQIDIARKIMVHQNFDPSTQSKMLDTLAIAIRCCQTELITELLEHKYYTSMDPEVLAMYVSHSLVNSGSIEVLSFLMNHEKIRGNIPSLLLLTNAVKQKTSVAKLRFLLANGCQDGPIKAGSLITFKDLATLNNPKDILAIFNGGLREVVAASDLAFFKLYIKIYPLTAADFPIICDTFDRALDLNDMKLFNMLSKLGMSVNTKNEMGKNAFHRLFVLGRHQDSAIYYWDFVADADILQSYIERGVEFDFLLVDLEVRLEPQTPLFALISEGKKEAAEVLMKNGGELHYPKQTALEIHGVSLTFEDIQGISYHSFHAIILQRQMPNACKAAFFDENIPIKVKAKFLEAFKEINRRRYDNFDFDKILNQALRQAIINKDSEAIKLFINNGADLNYKDRINSTSCMPSNFALLVREMLDVPEIIEFAIDRLKSHQISEVENIDAVAQVASVSSYYSGVVLRKLNCELLKHDAVLKAKIFRKVIESKNAEAVKNFLSDGVDLGYYPGRPSLTSFGLLCYNFSPGSDIVLPTIDKITEAVLNMDQRALIKLASSAHEASARAVIQKLKSLPNRCEVQRAKVFNDAFLNTSLKKIFIDEGAIDINKYMRSRGYNSKIWNDDAFMRANISKVDFSLPRQRRFSCPPFAELLLSLAGRDENIKQNVYAYIVLRENDINVEASVDSNLKITYRSGGKDISAIELLNERVNDHDQKIFNSIYRDTRSDIGDLQAHYYAEKYLGYSPFKATVEFVEKRHMTCRLLKYNNYTIPPRYYLYTASALATVASLYAGYKYALPPMVTTAKYLGAKTMDIGRFVVEKSVNGYNTAAPCITYVGSGIKSGVSHAYSAASSTIMYDASYLAKPFTSAYSSMKSSGISMYSGVSDYMVKSSAAVAYHIVKLSTAATDYVVSTVMTPINYASHLYNNTYPIAALSKACSPVISTLRYRFVDIPMKFKDGVVDSILVGLAGAKLFVSGVANYIPK